MCAPGRARCTPGTGRARCRQTAPGNRARVGRGGSAGRHPGTPPHAAIPSARKSPPRSPTSSPPLANTSSRSMVCGPPCSGPAHHPSSAPPHSSSPTGISTRPGEFGCAQPDIAYSRRYPAAGDQNIEIVSLRTTRTLQLRDHILRGRIHRRAAVCHQNSSRSARCTTNQKRSVTTVAPTATFQYPSTQPQPSHSSHGRRSPIRRYVMVSSSRRGAPPLASAR